MMVFDIMQLQEMYATMGTERMIDCIKMKNKIYYKVW